MAVKNASIKLTVGTILSIAIVLVAYYLKTTTDIALKERLDGTLFGLLRAEKKATAAMVTKPKIAIGFGSCQDVVVQSEDIFLSRPVPENPVHVDSIDSWDDLLQVFAYFFRHGAAAERYVSNSSLFGELVAIAQQSESAVWLMGGNAPVMASRLSKEGCDVLLGAQMTSALQEHLPEDIIVSGPETTEDDIHMLLEYPAGAVWGKYVAPRANRLIIHSDRQNPFITSLDAFRSEVKEFTPDLLVIGGLQMMDNFPYKSGLREELLKKVQKVIASEPPSVRVHFELASFSEQSLLLDLVKYLVPHVDSLGMNEQELPNLLGILSHGNISLVSDSYPRVATSLDQMRDLYRLLKEKSSDGSRKLTRLHLHTLAFQAIMTVKGSAWKNSMSSSAKAALTAHRHTCDSDRIDTAKAKLIMDDSFTTSRGQHAERIVFNAERPVACWDEGEIHICVAPVLVCTQVRQTGGGGDNISAAGLVLQI